MKQSLCKWALAPLVACALLAPAQLRAQAVKFEATGLQIQDLMPGVICFDASGVLHRLGYAHVIKFESVDPRMTGRGVGILNTEFQPDGTATFEGFGYTEVGT